MNLTDDYTINELTSKFSESLNLTLKNDIYLMEINANERSISCKLAGYLQKEFPEWDVDCEYNRDKDQVKLRSNNSDGFIPDIIVHIRGKPDNLLVIEVKKSNGDYNDEEKRLEEATSGHFKYTLGIYVIFNVLEKAKDPPTVKFYSEGKVIPQ